MITRSMTNKSRKRKADEVGAPIASVYSLKGHPPPMDIESVPRITLRLNATITVRKCLAQLRFKHFGGNFTMELGSIDAAKFSDYSNPLECFSVDADQTLELARKGIMGYCATNMCLCKHCYEVLDSTHMRDGIERYSGLSSEKLQEARSKVVIDDITVIGTPSCITWKNGMPHLDMCVSLRRLMISGVTVKSTAFLKECTRLEVLHIASCKMGPLFPPEIRELRNLKTLSVTENRLTEGDIDSEIFALPCLRSVDFCYNEIRELPFTWGRFQGYFEFTSNPCLGFGEMEKYLTGYGQQVLTAEDNGTLFVVGSRAEEYRVQLLRSQYKLAMILCNGLAGEARPEWITFLLRGLYDPRLFLIIYAFAVDPDAIAAAMDIHSEADSSSIDFVAPDITFFYDVRMPPAVEETKEAEGDESDDSDSFIAKEGEEEDGEESYNPSVDQVDAEDDSSASSSSSSERK